MAPVHLGTGPAPNFLTPGQISSSLVPNPVPATPHAPPTNYELKILFQPMFDEYLNLLVLKDRFFLLKRYKLRLTQPVHLHLPPLIKMHHLLVFHRHLRPYNLIVYIKVLQLNPITWKTIPLLPLTITPSQMSLLRNL
nr:hypothetical protein [Tanacetum cinerariifolium]